MTMSVVLRKGELLLPVVDEMLRFARGRLAKAATPKALRARDELFASAQPGMAAELVEYFEGILARAGVAKDVAFPFDPDEDIDWAEERALLTDLFVTWYVLLGEAAYGALGEQLAITLTFNLEGPSTARIRERLANDVTGVTDTMRGLLRDRVEAAIAAGLSVEQLVAGTEEVGGLRDLFATRAYTIALTETATAYNLASAAGYRDSGLVDRVLIFDGPECGWTEHDDPDLADGSTRTLDEYEAFPTAHPNCQRAAGPVVTE